MLTEADLRNAISRRDILKGFLAVAVGTPLVASCGPEKIVETGPKPIDEPTLKTIYQTLDQTNRPFLQKVASGIQTLHTAKQRPPEFPNWITDYSFPLKISIVNSLMSRAILAKFNYQNTVNYTEHSRTNSRVFTGLAEDYRLEMELGFPKQYESLNPIIRSELAAKEFLGLPTFIAMGDQFYDVLTQNGFTYGNEQGEPIRDPKTQQQIGLAIFYDQVKALNNETYILSDRLPQLLIIPDLVELYRQGKLPNEFFGVFPYMAHNFETYQNSSDQVKQQLEQLRSEWVNSDGLLLPPNTTTILYSHDFKALTSKIKTEPGQ